MAAILLIDDYDDFRYLLRRLLSIKGHEVFEARDGRSGLDTAREVHPDVIVLDMGLSEVDGWAVKKELERTPALAKIPVIALTSRKMRPDDGRAAVPFESYLTKPFDLPTFLSALDSVLEPRVSEA